MLLQKAEVQQQFIVTSQDGKQVNVADARTVFISRHDGIKIKKSEFSPRRRHRAVSIVLFSITIFAVFAVTIGFFVKIPTGGTTEDENSASNDTAPNNEESSFNCSATQQCLNRLLIMEKYMNQKADPCVDFYEYACGNFKASDDEDPDKMVRAFDVMSAAFQKRLHATLNGTSSATSESHYKAQLYFNACIDEDCALNVAAVQQIVETMGGFRFVGENSPVPDFNKTLSSALSFNSNTVISLSLLNSSTIILDGGSNNLLRYSKKEMAEVVKAIFPDSVEDSIAAEIDRLSAFEQQLYNLDILQYLPWREMRETFSLDKLQRLIDQIDWEKLFATVTSMMVNSGNINITSVQLSPTGPRFLRNLNRFLSENANNQTTRRLMHNYLVFKSVLPHFNGRKNLPEKSQRIAQCIEEVGAVMPHAVASMFEEQSTRTQVTSMFDKLKRLFEEHVAGNSSRLNQQTKEFFKSNLKSLKLLLGLPEWALDEKQLDQFYSNLQVTRSSVQNSVNAYLFQFGQVSFNLEDNLWHLLATSVNALLYSTTKIFVSVAALQQPLFDSAYEDALNIGGLGFVLSHELNHLFDRYEEHDNDQFLVDRQTCTSAYYSRFSFNGVELPSSQTVNDDVADIGGLKLAYELFKTMQQFDNGNSTFVFPESKTIVNGDQLFFLSFAQNFCMAFSERALEIAVALADHSPGIYRVNGTLAQVGEFAAAFNCPVKPASMNPQNKCNLI